MLVAASVKAQEATPFWETSTGAPPAAAPVQAAPVAPVHGAATTTAAPALAPPSSSRAPTMGADADLYAGRGWVAETAPDWGWIAAGIVTWAIGYGAAIAMATAGLSETGRNASCANEFGGWSLLPVLGPLIGVIHLVTCGEPHYNAPEIIVLLGSLPTVAQGLGAIMILGGALANLETGGLRRAGTLHLSPGAAGSDAGLTLTWLAE
ncbi:MAG: hypothetical protein KF729_24360 [Sandaracinaceae bacterium]|nr:hypothetical protein [Sandaracinaceae bacterium]